jgi:serralysin
MAFVSDLTKVPVSGYLHIDALLDQGPDWNYLTPYSNTILYTFSVASGNEPGQTGQAAFSAAQQQHTVGAMNYVSQLTGINFVQTTDGNAAHVHFANTNITHSPQTTGLASWRTSYNYDRGSYQLTSYNVDTYIYLDNVEFRSQNADLTPGRAGYETLLHEIGHMLGLKHPFDTTTGNSTTLPDSLDKPLNTLMSYDWSPTSYGQFSQYDVAALMWLYGGDGLGGKLGTDTAARYLVGTNGADQLSGYNGNDVLRGDGGNDTLHGLDGIDTAAFSAARANYTVTRTSTGATVTDRTGTGGTDTLYNVERIQFGDMAVAVDIDGNGGEAYRIYQAAFDRAPDMSGVGFWMARLDSGVTLESTASGFMSSTEFLTMYGANPTNLQFVEKLYQNVLDRAGEAAGVNFWVGALDANHTNRAEVLAHFSESLENQQNVAEVIGNGFAYVPFA